MRELLGETTPKEEQDHHHLIETPPIPVMGGAIFDPKRLEILSETVRAAAAKVGPWKGPVYGTAVHTEFKEQIKKMGRGGLHSEQSYLKGEPADYGTPDSIRVDAALGTKKNPEAIVDVKTGTAKLTKPRIEEMRLHLPKSETGEDIPIFEIRP